MKITTEIRFDFAPFRVGATKSGGKMKITTEIHPDFAPA